MNLSLHRYLVAAFAMAIAILFLFTPPGHADDDAALDAYGGWTGIKGKKTGFFHVEEIDGRNWFVTPEGNVFFAVALSHMLSGITNQDVHAETANDAQRATGYVHVERIDGVWWFIGPEGDKFISMGVNHIEPHLDQRHFAAWRSVARQMEVARAPAGALPEPRGCGESLGAAGQSNLRHLLGRNVTIG